MVYLRTVNRPTDDFYSPCRPDDAALLIKLLTIKRYFDKYIFFYNRISSYDDNQLYSMAAYMMSGWTKWNCLVRKKNLQKAADKTLYKNDKVHEKFLRIKEW